MVQVRQEARASNRIPATKNRANFPTVHLSLLQTRTRKVLLKPVLLSAPRRPHRTEEEPQALPSSFELSPGGVFNILTNSRVLLLFQAKLVKPADLPFKAQAPLPREKLKVS